MQKFFRKYFMVDNVLFTIVLLDGRQNTSKNDTPTGRETMISPGNGVHFASTSSIRKTNDTSKMSQQHSETTDEQY